MRFLPDIFRRTPAPVLPTKARAPTQYEHFLQCLSRAPAVRPREASVWAFVTWMQELGEHKGREQALLYEDYKSICRKTGVERMPWKWFGEAVEGLGCRRWKEEMERDGERARPIFVRIPPLVAGVGTRGVEPESVVRLHRKSSRGFKPRRPVVSHETIYNSGEVDARRIG